MLSIRIWLNWSQAQAKRVKCNPSSLFSERYDIVYIGNEFIFLSVFDASGDISLSGAVRICLKQLWLLYSTTWSVRWHVTGGIKSVLCRCLTWFMFLSLECIPALYMQPLIWTVRSCSDHLWQRGLSICVGCAVISHWRCPLWGEN